MRRSHWLGVPVVAATAGVLYYLSLAPTSEAGGLGGAAALPVQAAESTGAPAPLPALQNPRADTPATALETAGRDPAGTGAGRVAAPEGSGTDAAAVSARGRRIARGRAAASGDTERPDHGSVRGRVLDHDGSDAGAIAVGALRVKADFDVVKEWRTVRDVVADLRAGRSRYGLQRETTAKDGTYRLDLEPGRHYLLLAATSDLHAAQVVTAEAAARGDVDLRMPAPAQVALSGLVRGHDGKPLAHARIRVGWKAGRQVEAVSGPDGTFTMPRLYPYLQGPTVVRMEVAEARHDTVALELHCYDADHLRLAHDAGEVKDYDLRPIGRDTFHLDITLAEASRDDVRDD